jgi:hypothetical protein
MFKSCLHHVDLVLRLDVPNIMTQVIRIKILHQQLNASYLITLNSPVANNIPNSVIRQYTYIYLSVR